MPWRRLVEPFARPFFHGYARATRGLTLGVRGLVLDEDDRVLLVEHTYIKGWYMPGGGVERGEPVEAALARELVEEAGVEMLDRPTLLSVHDNGRKFAGDHVLIYRVNCWRPVAASQHGEILRTGFFAPGALPDDTTRATRNRIHEALEGVSSDLLW